MFSEAYPVGIFLQTKDLMGLSCSVSLKKQKEAHLTVLGKKIEGIYKTCFENIYPVAIAFS